MLESTVELWGWSSKAVWYAVAKRLKINCELIGSVVCPFIHFLQGAERQASGVQLGPLKFIRLCPKRALCTRLAVHFECCVTRTSCMWSALVELRVLQIRKNSCPSAQRPPIVDKINGIQLLELRSLPAGSLRG